MLVFKSKRGKFCKGYEILVKYMESSRESHSFISTKHLPFLVNWTEQTSLPSCACVKVAIHLLETPSQILMEPSVDPLT